METLRSKVSQLGRQDDLRCRAISELAISLDIEFGQAERLVELMILKTKEVSVC